MKDPWWHIAYRGVLWAIVLAWVAFAVRGAGFHALPLIVLPSFSAWVLGERRGYVKGHKHGVQEALTMIDNDNWDKRNEWHRRNR